MCKGFLGEAKLRLSFEVRRSPGQRERKFYLEVLISRKAQRFGDSLVELQVLLYGFGTE